ncbi:MAG: helix-turn-helix transcriptional regulator [Ruminococcus sp.]|nr:helix-turn-helix transcriptional regulator [Ruminococcus sp.]
MIGRRIKNRREELGLTQPELAEISKLSQGYISRIESGKFIPKASTLIAIATSLKMSYHELIA